MTHNRWPEEAALLGNAGPQRARLLTLLAKDGRVASHLEPSEAYWSVFTWASSSTP